MAGIGRHQLDQLGEQGSATSKETGQGLKRGDILEGGAIFNRKSGYSGGYLLGTQLAAQATQSVLAPACSD